jgi:hypothetical protein
MRPSLHRPTLAALLALASMAVLHARASAETYRLDGYELGVTLRPAREPFVLGETIDLEMQFDNRSYGSAPRPPGLELCKAARLS